MATNVTKNGTKPVKCAVCGKVVTTPNSVTNNVGTLCAHLAAKYGVTGLQQLHTTKVVQNTVGLYKTAQLHKVCAQLGISINKMVAGFGGDRGIYPTTIPGMQFVYNQHNHRFITGVCFTLTALQLLTSQKLTASAVSTAVSTVLGKQAAQQIAKLPATYQQITPAQYVQYGGYTPKQTAIVTTTQQAQ